MNIIEHGDAWEKLCPFLNVPKPRNSHNFPYFNPGDIRTKTRTLHLNKNSKSSREDVSPLPISGTQISNEAS